MTTDVVRCMDGPYEGHEFGPEYGLGTGAVTMGGAKNDGVPCRYLRKEGTNELWHDETYDNETHRANSHYGICEGGLHDGHMFPEPPSGSFVSFPNPDGGSSRYEQTESQHWDGYWVWRFTSSTSTTEALA